MVFMRTMLPLVMVKLKRLVCPILDKSWSFGFNLLAYRDFHFPTHEKVTLIVEEYLRGLTDMLFRNYFN